MKSEIYKNIKSCNLWTLPARGNQNKHKQNKKLSEIMEKKKLEWRNLPKSLSKSILEVIENEFKFQKMTPVQVNTERKIYS